MENNAGKSRKEIVCDIKEEIKQSTLIPCCEVTLSRGEFGIFDSKVGGLPYLPDGAKAPVNNKGKRLQFLAQINFGELPELEDFPRKGMLQFFISDDDLYGCTFDVSTQNKQNNWRVVYYPEIDRSADPEKIAQIFGEQEPELFPCTGEYRMSFELSEEGMSICDFRFEKKFVQLWNELFPEETIDDLYDIDDDLFEILFDGIGDNDDEPEETQKKWDHKLGGYPFFTQTDPRSDDKYDTLLFQLDSDYSGDNDILWGDMGVGNFFINREALKNLDFSDVLYNWDCS